uniref:Serine/threonine-protein kinase PLK n=1 Tax=Meloidogyne incognita TaxID=6306 RepID=A0A914M9N4_MELIC
MTTAQKKSKPILKEVPDLVCDGSTKQTYTKGKFLGKGGFARCYELTNNKTKIVYAGKVVSKTLLMKKHQRDKMKQEVQIQKMLSHPNVVKMEGFFEDEDNVYILLELCSRRSLMELHKRRRAVTEPEARYFTHQIVLACHYLHSMRVIHRDLKLGNLFLNEDMQVKIGDFGLATTLNHEGERKKTLCGTPNYIAPEMLDKKGHSFEVDVWAIGCILYTLLVGKPPFETETLKDTYSRIKNNQYTVPPRIGKDATALISRLLAHEPCRRPKIDEILNFPFFTDGFLPKILPSSCLTMAPKFNMQAVSGGQTCAPNSSDVQPSPRSKGPAFTGRAPLAPVPEAKETPPMVTHKQDKAAVLITEMPAGENNGVPQDYYLSDLYAQLCSLLNTNTERFNEADRGEIEHPASTPIYWVSRWVDYSDKYGLGYQFCDNSVGVLFNDNTKVILDAPGIQLQYTERNNMEHFYAADKYPQALEKKITLLKYFRSYMNEHLIKTGANIPIREGDELARLPCLNTWFRTKSAIVLHLSNGTLQINFFYDHSKLIVCPLMSAATYIDQAKNVFTCKFSLLEQYGCPKELLHRLKYTKVMVERLISRNAATNHGDLKEGGGRHDIVVVEGSGCGSIGGGGGGTTTSSRLPVNF